MAEQPAAALVVHEERSALQLAFEPRDFEGLVAMCRVLFLSQLLPKAITKVEAAVYIALRGRELGLSIGQSFASIFVIDGKTVLSGDLIAARVRRSKACKRWRVITLTNTKCTLETQRVEDTEPTSLTWTIEDAQQAGLTGRDNWRKYPRAMLRARCSAELARAVYPEEALGMYDPDELGHPANDTAAPVAGELVGEVVLPTASPTPPAAARKASDVAREYANRMRDCATAEALAELWAEIETKPFKENVLNALRGLFDSAHQELAAQAANDTMQEGA